MIPKVSRSDDIPTITITYKYSELLDSEGFKKLCDQAITEAMKLEPDECFLLQDLFVGQLWKKLHPGDRKSFGRFFSFYVQDKGSKIIKLAGRTRQNQSVYCKK